MSETERVINDLNTAKLILCNPQTLTPEMCIKIGQTITSSIALLKEQPEIVRCKDCEYCYTEGFVHERLVCEKHPEFCDLKEDWFCADCWKA